MIKRYLPLLIIYWIFSTIINAGAIHASNMAEFSFKRNSLKACREDLGLALLWGVFPFTTPMGFMFTGFWYSGFNWSCDGIRE